jgi:hypothetical protein
MQRILKEDVGRRQFIDDSGVPRVRLLRAISAEVVRGWRHARGPGTNESTRDYGYGGPLKLRFLPSNQMLMPHLVRMISSQETECSRTSRGPIVKDCVDDCTRHTMSADRTTGASSARKDLLAREGVV